MPGKGWEGNCSMHMMSAMHAMCAMCAMLPKGGNDSTTTPQHTTKPETKSTAGLQDRIVQGTSLLMNSSLNMEHDTM